MKVVDFNGRQHNWPPIGHQPNLNETRPRSDLHLRARALLKELYPTRRILEEVPIPGESMFLDFYLPHSQTAVEVNGQQHYMFNSHFYKTQADFLSSKKRDRRKAEWCAVNNIVLVIFDYNESTEVWASKL